ncbi:2-oxo acid dehydrogenase subunit E2 [Buchnera aphidicola (Mindarus keteleerifoliae)]|uniref:2-oxo acid dehydrogenase subunit E2 n=1 Tax=Buchnera aphidicola TaxID=9 RepID=UPI0031B6A0BD
MNIEVKIPDIGRDLVEVIEILVKKNDKIKKEQILIVVEGQKASMEIPSPFSGTIKEVLINIGDKVKYNDVIFIMNLESEQINSDNQYFSSGFEEEKINFISKKRKSEKNIFFHASPLIRRLARLLKINLKNLKGSGRKGRILKEDLELYKNKKNESLEFKKNKIIDVVKDLKNSYTTKDQIKLTKIQLASGQNLKKSWNDIPHVTQFYESDITELEKFRKEINLLKKEEQDQKITLLSVITKVVARALEKFSWFNSFFSNEKNSFILNKDINIGIAVDTKDGLVVPVIKKVNKKRLSQLSYEIFLKCRKARKKKLALLDFQNGSFTISSLGKLGGTGFTPIINAPQVGILGVSKTFIKPIWRKNGFVPRLILPFSLSYDHRIIDGVYGAKFMEYISNFLSEIRLLIL